MDRDEETDSSTEEESSSCGRAHLDLDLVEDLAVVDAHDTPNHLGHYNHVPQVCFDHGWFLHRRCFFLGLPQTLDEC